MDTATKTGIDAAKTTSKRIAQKTAEATGDLIGNKTADKITSLGKTKIKEKEKRQEIYILPEKRQQIIDNLRLFQASYKNEIPKKIQTYQLQHPMKYLDLLLKNGQKFMISRVKLMIDTNQINK